jgi:hypothetical protein
MAVRTMSLVAKCHDTSLGGLKVVGVDLIARKASFGWRGHLRKDYNVLFRYWVQWQKSCASMSMNVSFMRAGMYIRQAFRLRLVSPSFLAHAAYCLSYESICHSLAPLSPLYLPR